jgi:predicted TIM-barrel fold metal-dependent hydrolase
MIVDVHAHPVFAGTPIHPGVHQLSRAYYYRSALEITVSEFVRELDLAHVDRAVLLTVAWKDGPVRQRNEATAEIVQKYSDRLIGFAAFNPNAGGQAVAELEYAVHELRFRGAKVVAQNVEMLYNDPRYHPIYAKIQELGIPIMFHTGPSFLGTRSQYGDPLTLEDVALAFPNMKIIVAHLSMHRFMEAHSLLVRYPNVSADLSFWPLHPAYRDLIPWRLFEETVSEKLLMGSDFPVGQTPVEAVEAVKSLPIGDRFKARILGENAAKLLEI